MLCNFVPTVHMDSKGEIIVCYLPKTNDLDKTCCHNHGTLCIHIYSSKS